ncbi:protein RESPONSE TO ABA AND SALT 1-like [Macadamia integrifolia]|uniref:protein RESPONSE TO ABA AND SALT 1-like n=1 Tax=Macadamia integrifolia TaxID=60698 RepID=UPI001C4EBE7C|nr:protein RESPONSE TO ABA AND SALT 1-like [Macadamia integrifolia]
MAYHTTGRTSNIVSRFESFYEGWLVRQEHYLDELLSAQNNPCDSARREEELRELITRVLSHYQQYFEEKSTVANADVFLLFSPAWFSPFERTFLWIAGFKPGMIVRLVENSVKDMSEEQKQRLDMVRAETKAQEKQLSDELARVQESLAAPPLLELMRRGRRLVDGELRQTDRVLEILSSSMETLVGNADFLRLATVKEVTDLLNPFQTVKFLASVTQLQLRVRTWGRQREAERPRRVQ